MTAIRAGISAHRGRRPRPWFPPAAARTARGERRCRSPGATARPRPVRIGQLVTVEEDEEVTTPEDRMPMAEGDKLSTEVQKLLVSVLPVEPGKLHGDALAHQGEPVMGGDEIDAGAGAPPRPPVQVGAAGQPVGEIRQGVVSATPASGIPAVTVRWLTRPRRAGRKPAPRPTCAPPPARGGAP
jgi:hypothetical protein